MTPVQCLALQAVHGFTEAMMTFLAMILLGIVALHIRYCQQLNKYRAVGAQSTKRYMKAKQRARVAKVARNTLLCGFVFIVALNWRAVLFYFQY